MLILAISDIHGDIASIERMSSALAGADLVLVSGDITNFGGRGQASSVLEILRRQARRFLAVSGNCDRPEVGELLAENGWSLDGRAVEIEGLWFLGLAGSLPCPGRTLLEFGEEDLAESLESAYGEMPPGKPFVLLCHQPPYGTKVDRAMGGIHVGSRAIRRFIEDRKPLACLCGHIHEAKGSDMIGDTVICNPGPAGRGCYVWAVWDGSRIKPEIRKKE